MSEHIKIAAQAVDYIEGLFVEIIEGDHDDNEVLLGTVLVGNKSFQIQLKVTANPDDFMDEC